MAGGRANHREVIAGLHGGAGQPQRVERRLYPRTDLGQEFSPRPERKGDDFSPTDFPPRGAKAWFRTFDGDGAVVLEAAGLVRRIPHPTDRRTTLVELLEPGRKLALQATEDLNAEVFRSPGISPEAVTTLVETLTELRRTAGDF